MIDANTQYTNETEATGANGFGTAGTGIQPASQEYKVEFLGNDLSLHGINSIIKNRINSKLTRDGSNLLPVLLYIFIFTFSG